MKFLAAYIMRGRMQAGLVAAVTAILSLVMPPVSYLSGAAVGLFTLHKGPRQGLQVSLLAAVATAVLATFTVGSPMFGLAFILVLWLPIWALAASLRRTVNLSHSVWLAALFGAVLILGLHASVDDPALWWTGILQDYMSEALQGQDGEQVEQLLALVPDVARLMTGVLAGTLCLTLLGSLFIARWWQAMLYNPGGFSREFHELRLGKSLSIGAGVLALLSSVIESDSAVAGDLIILALVMLMLQGLAVIHGLVARTKAHVGWLIGVYLLLVIAMLQTVLILALAGFADAWFDFRGFFNRDKSDKETD